MSPAQRPILINGPRQAPFATILTTEREIVNPSNVSQTVRFVLVNGIRLRVVEAGPADGPVIVLLHGFPEFSYSWRHQIPFLAEAGFRVIAPDLRGYNLSDKPPRVRDYRIEKLVLDITLLIGQTSAGRATLVGHDWGGIIAWFTAMWHPECLERLVILNAPHPAAYIRELGRSSQLLRSWYALFFQVPWIPERVISWSDFAMARKLFRGGPARNSNEREADVRRYIESLAQPGALTAAINYYRAALRYDSRRVSSIQTSTLLIWGHRDAYLVPELASDLEQWVKELRVEHLPDATHWVQNDEPEKVNGLIKEFCSRKHGSSRGEPGAS